ncbi:hypothetical protein AHAS_Ahas19G0142300 [Arachis hypogaea]
MPFSHAEVVQKVHPDILDPLHTMLWRAVTILIYFVVVKWHQVDRVLPQLGGIQRQPCVALNIDYLMSNDGRKLFFSDRRAIEILAKAAQRGIGQAPPMEQVHDVPDKHHLEW